MAKKKPDVLANETYMNNAALIAFNNRLRAVEKRSDYIWAVPRKFHSQDIQKSCNLEAKINKADEIFSRKNENSKIDLIVPKVDIEVKQSVLPNSKENIRERYKKQILESRKWAVVGSDKSSQLNMDTESLNPRNEEDYMKEIPKTYESSKQILSTENIFKEQKFTSRMNTSWEKSASDKFNDQMKKVPHSNSSHMQEDCKTSKIISASRASSGEILSNNLHPTQNQLKRKQLRLDQQNENMFESARSTSNVYSQSRRDDNYSFCAQRMEENNFTEKRIRRDSYELSEKKNLWTTHKSLPDLKPYLPKEKRINEVFKKTTKSLLSLNIWKYDDSHEFIIDLSDFNRIKQRYPKILQAMPDIDTDEKEVRYCFEAMKSIMTYVFY